jgi:hypothetical protein
MCRSYGTRFYFPPDPGLPPWAKLFRPARRDWRIGQKDAEQIEKLRTNKIPTLAKRRLGWGTRHPSVVTFVLGNAFSPHPIHPRNIK